MKLLVLISSFLFFGFTSNLAIYNNSVYICNSSTATKYHYKSDCRGLNACKSKIVKISLTDAKKDGRKLCGWED